MKRLELYFLCLCFVLSASELLGPDDSKKKENDEEEDSGDSLDSKYQTVDADYFKELKDAMNKEIVTLQEYADALRNTKDVPKDEETNKDNHLDQMEYTLKLLKKSLLRHTETAWIHDPKASVRASRNPHKKMSECQGE